MKKFDVYSFGMIAASTLYLLKDKYPEADSYAEIKGSYKMTGGEAANSSIVLSKLGVSVKLDGSWIGKSDGGLNTLKILQNFNIDTSSLQPKEGYNGVEELVIADNNSRTIFGTYVSLFDEKQWNTPVEDDIKSSRIVCLDPFFGEDSKSVSRICRKLDIPYVTVDCEYTDEVAQNADIVIISGEFRKGKYGDMDKEELFNSYIDTSRGLVIFTSGESDVLYGRKGGEINCMKPFSIQPVDTAGAGDSFRSGIIYGTLQGWSEEKTIGFACAMAAYICESFPGVLNCPDYDKLLEYIESKQGKLEL